MKANQLKVLIHKPVEEVFTYVITPPNSVYWIPNVIKETVDKWPPHVGSLYTLTYPDKTECVIVTAFAYNKYIEWSSQDGFYHCGYSFKKMGLNKTEFEYQEWVDQGTISQPFTFKVLNKLKNILEG